MKDSNVVSTRRRKRIAIVIANPSQSTTTGWPVGFWWSELTHPFLEFSEQGYEVEVFSPLGGPCEADGMSDPNDASGYCRTDIITQGFIHTTELRSLVDNTRRVSEMDADTFDAIVVAGGQSPMFTFDKATNLQVKFAEFYEKGKIACALCHGSAILRYAKLSNGEYLVKEKTVTGFANVEEDFDDNSVWGMNLLPRDKHLMPWRIEDELKKLGANYVRSGIWRSFAIRDGNLITGQQNFSGRETARLVIAALGE